MRKAASDTFFLLLEQEREALLKGDFDQVARLAEDKEKAAFALRKSQVGAEMMSRISEEMKRSQHLLKAAIDGVKVAQTGLKQTRDVGRSGTVYTPEGQRSYVQTINPTTSHRI